ncbi:MAG: hypothetical protein QM736_07450 [Vicinamibacterales bacterium]
MGKPSIRKLLERTAPPPIESAELPVWSCMRFQWAFALATTVGVSVAMRNTLRPSEGISLKSAASSVLACEALLVSISGAAAVTVMFSCRPPTSRTMSMLRNCWVPTRTFVFTYGRKPGTSTLIV